MISEILTYSQPGVIDTYNGRAWFDACDICPYCKTHLELESKDYHSPSAVVGNGVCLDCFNSNSTSRTEREPVQVVDGINLFYPTYQSPIYSCLLKVAECPTCGWWYVVSKADQCNDGFAIIHSGILQAFNTSDADIPVQALITEIKQNPKILNIVNPYRLEDIIGAILAGVYNCEVINMGYSRDGGVDLVLLMSDKPIAVQVKRRIDPKKTESVQVVREFLAATLLSGNREAIFVTTAQRYSNEAKEAAKISVKEGFVSRYELIDRHGIEAFAGLAPAIGVWSTALKKTLEKEGGGIVIPCPAEYANLLRAT